MKKVLVIGGGGREHAIVDAPSRSPQVGKIYCAPGNAGISAQAECVAIKDTDVEGLKAFALENSIDLAVVGPEVARAAGVVEAYQNSGYGGFSGVTYGNLMFGDYDSFDGVNSRSKGIQAENNNKLAKNQQEGKQVRADSKYGGSK
jgi:hypothetical protein